MASFWGKQIYLTINGHKIELYKFERTVLDRNILRFEFIVNPHCCEFFYAVCENQEQITFEFEYEEYAGFEFKGFVIRFDKCDKKLDQVYLELQIGGFSKMEKKDAV